MGGRGGPRNLDESWAFDTRATLLYRALSGSKTYTQRIAHELQPYCVRPDLRLRDTVKNQNIRNNQMIILGTEFDEGRSPQGGMNGAPMIEKFSLVRKVTFRMWIEEIEEERG